MVSPILGQTIPWIQRYPQPKTDELNCVAKDAFGNVYAGCTSHHNKLWPGGDPRAMIYKLNPDGDTVFVRWTGYYGSARALMVNQFGDIRMVVSHDGVYFNPFPAYQVLTMTPEGFVYKADTLYTNLYAYHSCVGRDGSWVICGSRMSDSLGFLYNEFFVQRILPDGTIMPFIRIYPGYSVEALRAEQLPNGKYRVSGVGAGRRAVSYLFNEDISQYEQERVYIRPDMAQQFNSNFSHAHHGGYILASQGYPSMIGLFDSLGNQQWMKRDTGRLFRPYGMTDGSLLVGYSGRPKNPSSFVARWDSNGNPIWFVHLTDSLIAKGIVGGLEANDFVFFEDGSVVIAGHHYQNGQTAEDPIFIKITNAGTPITSLSKPRKGTLANHTLAPWPNPSDGTLYLKQHFNQADVVLYTLSGREVGQYSLQFGQPIDLSEFPPGLYLYRALIDGQSYSGKVWRR